MINRVWDAIRSGTKVLGPHVNHSSLEWTKEGRAIRAGLGIVRELTLKTGYAIIEQRSKKQFTDIDDLRTRVKFSKPELQNLIHLNGYYQICSASGAVWARGMVNEHLSSIAIECRNCGKIRIPA